MLYCGGMASGGASVKHDDPTAALALAIRNRLAPDWEAVRETHGDQSYVTLLGGDRRRVDMWVSWWDTVEEKKKMLRVKPWSEVLLVRAPRPAADTGVLGASYLFVWGSGRGDKVPPGGQGWQRGSLGDLAVFAAACGDDRPQGLGAFRCEDIARLSAALSPAATDPAAGLPPVSGHVGAPDSGSGAADYAALALCAARAAHFAGQSGAFERHAGYDDSDTDIAHLRFTAGLRSEISHLARAASSVLQAYDKSGGSENDLAEMLRSADADGRGVPAADRVNWTLAGFGRMGRRMRAVQPWTARLLAEMAAEMMRHDRDNQSGGASSPKRVTDPACGTGALLAAARDAVSGMRRAGASSPKELEDADTFTWADPDLWHLAFADLNMGRAAEPGNHGHTEIHPPTGRLGAVGHTLGEDRRDIRAPWFHHRSSDLVISAPPTGELCEQAAQAAKTRLDRREVNAGDPKAGWASYYLDVAHTLVRPGGVIAMMMPPGLLNDDEWEDARYLLRKQYSFTTFLSVKGCDSLLVVAACSRESSERGRAIRYIDWSGWKPGSLQTAIAEGRRVIDRSCRLDKHLDYSLI